MKKKVLVWGFIFVSVLMLSINCYADETAAEKGDVISPDGNSDSYSIGRGDILEITTWKEPDFSLEEVTVRMDGKITFPLLDDIQAAGKTPIQVKETLEKGLSDFVESPSVTVSVKDPVSWKFYILGEVARTGEYKLQKELTVLQAFALAGGFTQWASKNQILLYRQENGGNKIIRVNYKDIMKGKNLDTNVLLKANDTIIVP